MASDLYDHDGGFWRCSSFNSKWFGADLDFDGSQFLIYGYALGSDWAFLQHHLGESEAHFVVEQDTQPALEMGFWPL